MNAGGTVVSLTDKIEGALASQEIRQAFFKEGWTNLELTPEREDRIIPANYDITIEPECWRVPDGFLPERGVSVIESLRRLNPRDRPHYDVTPENGVVLVPGFSYLFPLEGTWNIPQNFFLKSSPKSTEGRMGNLNRIVADFTPKYDQVRGPFHGRMYVLLNPLVFANLVFPGFSSVQLRAYCKKQDVLSDDDLRRLIHQQSLVQRDGRPLSIDELELEDGLLLTADLEGRNTNGLVGFRARRNPDPIDRRKKGELLNWFDYFDPIIAPPSGSLDLRKGDFNLVQSREWVKMTPTHAGVMIDVRTSLMEDRAHIAGYFDANAFEGIATLEIPVSRERPLRHGDPCCVLQYESVRVLPDKPYTGRHMGQKFALMPKHFKSPDPADIAGKVANDRELIMYVDRAKLFGRDHFEGFCPAERVDFRKRTLDNYDFAKRGNAKLGTGLECDSSKKQPICYLAFVNPKEKTVFTYVRASEVEKYSETRLHGKVSIGIGGHTRIADKRTNSADPLQAGSDRELNEEVELDSVLGPPQLVGYINADNALPVDAVHFGLFYVVKVNGPVRPKDAELKEGRMMKFDEVKAMMEDPKYAVETWTKIAFPVIEKMFS